MRPEELKMYEELLVLYYGRSYISDFFVLRDLLEIDFDINLSIEELKQFSTFDFSLADEDVELTIKHCGINY